MAIGKRQRSTRLSSGSVKKTSYVEDEDSNSEDNEKVASSTEEEQEDSNSEEEYKPEVKKSNKGGSSRGVAGSRSSGKKATSPSSDESDDMSDMSEEDDLDGEEEEEEEEEEGEDSDKRKVKSTPNKKRVESNDYQEIVEIVKAPKGKVPRGTISPHTIAFLQAMRDPAKNDRDWFAKHKNYIFANWIDFVEASTEELMENVDETIAWLPPKALIERIYRDVRFSNDKTPYKKYLSWCLSRNGRKGTFAKYYLTVSAGNSGLHAGQYEPGREELQSIRDHIVNNTAHGLALRSLVKQKDFCKLFGSPPAKGAQGGKRTSLWGTEDELKRSPKDYRPDHPDIDWLRLKQFIVSHRFSDEEVLSKDFLEKVVNVAQAAKPLVDIMNEISHGLGPTAPADEI
ncbi:hypothetical protein CBS101457_001957 [Exobasidium rhododendri]|nr:hypothetical protein CBS101457_001957 [Exobasidium rhododendri]